MEAYKELSRVRLPWATRNQVIYSRRLHHVEDTLSHQASQNIAKRLFLLQALHAALDDTDQILTAKINAAHQMDNEKLASSSVSQDSTCAAAAEIDHAPEPGQ